jgi:hypothetical protein
MIFESYDEGIHVIDRELRREGGHWALYSHGKKMTDLTYFVAGVDWRFRNAGSLLVAGIDHEKKAYIVDEVYRCRQDLEFWADEAERLRGKFDIQRFVCDPSRPEISRGSTQDSGELAGFT